MWMREKLVVLVGQVQDCGCDVTDVVEMNYVENIVLIDHLIANGVEIPKHGRWITHNKGQNNWCECSECNTVGSPFWKRCPVCEAKMDGERRTDG